MIKRRKNDSDIENNIVVGVFVLWEESRDSLCFEWY
jgi:hypothetical protein